MKIHFVIFVLCEVVVSILGQLNKNNFTSVKSHKYDSNEIFRNYNRKIKLKKHVALHKAKENGKFKKHYVNDSDIVLNENEFLEFKNINNKKRAVTANQEKLWPHGIVPFEISDVYKGDQILTFIKAMRLWELSTCILFIERNENHSHWISILKEECGCCSLVGRNLQPGAQNVSLGVLCDKIGIAAHEFGHVIGFWHEHTRPDRDSYIAVETANVISGHESNFDKKNSSEIKTFGEPYDFSSIMHYANNTFSNKDELLTIRTREKYSKETSKIGQRRNLSKSDIIQTNKLYQCTSCIETLYDTEGSLELPFKQEQQNCIWRIKANLGYIIKIKIDEFNIKPVNNTCKNNYVVVYDGPTFKKKLSARMCGYSIISAEFTSTKPYMLIQYVSNSDSERQNHKLKLTYKIICGGKLTNSIGSLNSPNFPEQYPTNITCEWMLEVPSEYKIEITFIYLNIEQSNNCNFDYLQIFDGDINANPVKNYTYCGTPQELNNIYSSSNKMFIRFTSDFIVTSNGFMIQYRQQLNPCKKNHGCEHNCVLEQNTYHCTCNDGFNLSSDGKSCTAIFTSTKLPKGFVRINEQCGGLIEAFSFSNGIIKSPQNMSNITSLDNDRVYNYPKDQDCFWILKTNKDNKFLINITYMDIEGEPGNCKYDFLNIYSINEDGTINYEHGYFCGNLTIDNLITSTTNEIGINFKSDDSVSKTGFSLSFQTDQDECFYKNGGCSQQCINEFSSYRCSCDIGFVLQHDNFTCEESLDCNHSITASEGGIISSPGFPKEYLSNQNCSWNISTKTGHRIYLVFKYFDVEPSNNCVYDHVLIENVASNVFKFNDSVINQYCGSELPLPIISSNSYIIVKLITDESGSRSGFKLEYTSVCGGDLYANNTEQTIYSHSKYGLVNYSKNENCTWNIRTDEDKCIYIYFQEFQLEHSDENLDKNECHYDSVEIVNLKKDRLNNQSTSTKLVSLCGFRRPNHTISFSNNIQVNFQTDSDQEYKGFVGSYKSVDCLSTN